MKLSLVIPLLMFGCSAHSEPTPIAPLRQPFPILCTSETMQAKDIYQACFDAANAMCNSRWQNAADLIYQQPVIVQERPNHFRMMISCK